MVFVAFSCNEKKEAIKNFKKIENVSAKKLNESFDTFNIQFHSDSIYQISRVAFPIGGKYVEGFEKYKWTQNNWRFLKTQVLKNNKIEDCKHSLIQNDTLVIEKFWIDNSGFKLERKFKRVNGKWYLTYYDDINL